jgi:hypothetical protein
MSSADDAPASPVYGPITCARSLVDNVFMIVKCPKVTENTPQAVSPLCMQSDPPSDRSQTQTSAMPKMHYQNRRNLLVNAIIGI